MPKGLDENIVKNKRCQSCGTPISADQEHFVRGYTLDSRAPMTGPIACRKCGWIMADQVTHPTTGAPMYALPPTVNQVDPTYQNYWSKQTYGTRCPICLRQGINTTSCPHMNDWNKF